MPSLMSMEDLFYGPPEPTWILPTRDEEPMRRYKEREYSPPRRFMNPDHQIRPVMRYDPRPPMDRDIRPVMRAEPRPAPVNHELRPIERLARVHTVPEPVPINAGNEEIRKVVEVPVPTAVPPPTQVVVNPPPPPHRAPAPVPPAQVQKRSISPPRPIVHHPIELKVPMCCEKCAKKVKDRLLDLEGVENVTTDQYNQKVIVYGHADPERVLQRVKLVKKRSAFWDMTVDYSEKYRRTRQQQADAIARENAKRAEAAKQQREQQSHAKAMVAPSKGPEVVVKLPQEPHAPQVTAILPADKGNTRPFIAEPHSQPQRYASPPRAYRQEFYNGGRPGY